MQTIHDTSFLLDKCQNHQEKSFCCVLMNLQIDQNMFERYIKSVELDV